MSKHELLVNSLTSHTGRSSVYMVFTQGRQIRNKLYCRFAGGASQLMHSGIHSTCKSLHAPPFKLLIVPCKSVYYNYIITMLWLVGRGSGQNGGLRLQKSALWPHV